MIIFGTDFGTSKMALQSRGENYYFVGKLPPKNRNISKGPTTTTNRPHFLSSLSLFGPSQPESLPSLPGELTLSSLTPLSPPSYPSSALPAPSSSLLSSLVSLKESSDKVNNSSSSSSNNKVIPSSDETGIYQQAGVVNGGIALSPPLKPNQSVSQPPAQNKILIQPAQMLEGSQTKGVGTPSYQAPEILEGRVAYDVAKTDVYSFGVLLWQLWTQVVPYSQPPYDLPSLPALIEFVVTGKRLPLPPQHVQWPAVVASLIPVCWHAQPTARPEFAEVLTLLNSCFKNLQEIQNSGPPNPALSPLLSFLHPNNNSNNNNNNNNNNTPPLSSTASSSSSSPAVSSLSQPSSSPLVNVSHINLNMVGNNNNNHSNEPAQSTIHESNNSTYGTNNIDNSVPPPSPNQHQSNSAGTDHTVLSQRSSLGMWTPTGSVKQITQIAWRGEYSREQSEVELAKTPKGTFLTRWSTSSKSYVVSHSLGDGVHVGHVAYIFPNNDGSVTVERNDGLKSLYPSLFEYVEKLKQIGTLFAPSNK
jgi:hypothetical protein